MDIALMVERLYGAADYGGAATYVDLQRTWRDARPLPTEAELEAAWTAYLAERDAKDTAADTLKQLIRTTAQGAVGKSLNTLTAAEQRTLLAVLLWKAGGVSDNATVKPLAEWL